ncbi:DUF6456 domain-containing protein [Rhizobium sp. FY34]|uniref:DUF6456 domain-containing protein n=1 Tax=Rhizobium sp. FY34 TaxID=2562309 RepID=UPI0010C09D01|nr:DUF6456 domain-containing protein [Rhizobium sp. FY34]
MNEAIDSFTRGERKALARLLRLLACGPAPLDITDPLVIRALRLGLISEAPEGFSARPEARGFLRRLLCDMPEDAYAEQHREIEIDTVVVETIRQTVRRNLNESPLAGLARLKDRQGTAFLPREAVEAGDRLASDFERGQMQPSMTARWEPRIDSAASGARGGQADLADSALAARNRVGQALDAMGPELSGVALDICCFGKGLELVERERGWPVRSAKLMLRTALLALARHYAPPAPRSRSTHRWGVEGYRPEL